MAKKRVFRQLTGVKNYRPWKEWEIEDLVVGKLIRIDKDQYRKNAYVLELEDVDFADADLAETLMGKPFVLNSVGILDRQFEDGHFDIGDVIQVVYKGTSVMTKGPNEGDEAHSIEISVASDDGDFDEALDEALEGDEFGGL